MAVRLVTLSLVALLLQCIPAKGQNPPNQSAADKVFSTVAKSGTCPKAKLIVTLHDQTKLKGCVQYAGKDDFTVVDAKTGQPTKVSYADVAKISKQRQPAWLNWALLGAAIGIPAAIIATALSSGGY